MMTRLTSPLAIACVALASQWMSASTPAQDTPPAPPLPLRIAQEQAPVP